MNPWVDLSVFGLVQFFMLIGLFGLVLPVFPGILVMWLAALGYGLATGFHPLGIALFVFITLLAISGSLVDNVLMGMGARKGGASWLSIAASTVAGIAGTLLWPPIGGMIAAPLVVLLIEYLRARQWRQAWAAFKGFFAGWLLSFAARFGIGILIMGLWWLWVWKG
ncbi:MAG TPA: DUF456 domain-containing protein [Anaerolineales bacterium]